MSTPDEQSAGKPSEPAADDLQAYKLNRAGMVSPAPAATSAAPTPVVPPSSAAPDAARPQTTPRAAGRTPRRRWIDYGLAALGGVLLGGGVWFLFTRDRPAPQHSVPLLLRGDGGQPAAAALPDYRALVIGINKYLAQGGDGWQTLQSARTDAEAVARTLDEHYGFHVRTLLDEEATRAGILQALDEFVSTGRDGADLIYFAGHGFFDEALQEGYWIPADARRSSGGREAKEDWIWNSTLTRLINASRARHVLVLSDACYSGSLFRGDEPLGARSSRAWYERAIAKPSRYLITSGGLEPVLDSGSGHSVFAQQILNYLLHADRTVFSANDLGLALRERVAALTGQMVQMGPLPVSGHAGGEFVFLRRTGPEGPVALTLRPAEDDAAAAATRPADPAAGASARREALRDAVALTRAGAPRAAGETLAALLQQDPQDRLARTVADYIARSQEHEARDELRTLIDAVAARARAAAVETDGAAQAAEARPRVLACLGPEPPAGSPPAVEAVALLYRLVLRANLEAQVGLRVIEREALETLLQEQNLGVSGLADPRARLAIGKLLPASLLLLGDLVATGTGEKLFLRLVDTETTQVLASFTAGRTEGEDLEPACEALAGKIAERVVALKPLRAPALRTGDNLLRAGLGLFHGVRPDSRFRVLTRTARDRQLPGDFIEEEVGTATVANVSEFGCDLEPAWSAGPPERRQELWVQEAPPPNSAP